MSFYEFPHTRTYDTDLGWLIKTVKDLLTCCDEMQGWKATHEAEYEQLKALYDAVMSGHFPESRVNAFKRWMNLNALDLIGDMIKNVWFGLTDSGYFVAYIPESWADIIFNTTGYDITILLQPDYGHLVLSY